LSIINIYVFTLYDKYLYTGGHAIMLHVLAIKTSMNFSMKDKSYSLINFLPHKIE